MIQTSGLSLKFLKREVYSGSHRGMRFRLQAPKEEETLHVWIYPEPWCFESAPEAERSHREFPFTQEGLEEAIQWLNASYEENIAGWTDRDKNKMRSRETLTG